MSVIKSGRIDSLTYNAYSTRDEMGAAAAADVANEIKKMLTKHDSINMIFAAAPSQSDFLACLVADQSIEWGRINAFHMDEYIGLPEDAPQGFANFLRRELFDLVPFGSVNCIDITASDPEKECERYARLLDENKCNIICMGIGENGHIAFNDPHVARFDDPLAVKPVSLDEKCRNQQVNDGCFASLDEVPTHAITLTIPTLVAPESVFCIVPAKTKANAVRRTLNGSISEECPATILRTHSNARLYLDADSAELI